MVNCCGDIDATMFYLLCIIECRHAFLFNDLWLDCKIDMRGNTSGVEIDYLSVECSSLPLMLGMFSLFGPSPCLRGVLEQQQKNLQNNC